MQPIEASMSADVLQLGGLSKKFRFHHALQVAERETTHADGGTVTVPEVWAEPGSKEQAQTLWKAFAEEVYSHGVSSIVDLGEGTTEEQWARFTAQVKVIELEPDQKYTSLGGHLHVHHKTDGLHE